MSAPPRIGPPTLKPRTTQWRATSHTRNSPVASEEDILQQQPDKTWPTPRFSSNCNGIVTDKLSGLIWLKNGDCFGAQDRNTAGSLANNLANVDTTGFKRSEVQFQDLLYQTVRAPGTQAA
jgi:hypothetical protein